MKRKRILFFVCGSILLLAFVKLLLANVLSLSGLRVAKLEEQVSSFEKENNLIKEEIVKLSSLSRISQEAVNLGLEKPTLVVNLTSGVPVALR